MGSKGSCQYVYGAFGKQPSFLWVGEFIGEQNKALFEIYLFWFLLQVARAKVQRGAMGDVLVFVGTLIHRVWWVLLMCGSSSWKAGGVSTVACLCQVLDVIQHSYLYTVFL